MARGDSAHETQLLAFMHSLCADIDNKECCIAHHPNCPAIWQQSRSQFSQLYLQFFTIILTWKAISVQRNPKTRSEQKFRGFQLEVNSDKLNFSPPNNNITVKYACLVYGFHYSSLKYQKIRFRPTPSTLPISPGFSCSILRSKMTRPEGRSSPLPSSSTERCELQKKKKTHLCARCFVDVSELRTMLPFSNTLRACRKPPLPQKYQKVWIMLGSLRMKRKMKATTEGQLLFLHMATMHT